MRALFFGQVAMLGKLRGKPTPSTTVRCTLLSQQLARLGFTSEIRYRSLRGFSRNLQAVKSNDLILFHRLQFPLVRAPEPPTEIFLQIVGRAAGKITIFDLDDAIFLQEPGLTELLTAKSDLVAVGSHQLLSYARKWNRQVYFLPSAVETNLFSPTSKRSSENHRIVLGWHGTAYLQMRYLRLLVPVLQQLGQRYDITFKLLGGMGDRKVQQLFEKIPKINLDLGPQEWIPYQQLPKYLGEIDVGLSPLSDSLWARGKCAMKALEYMSMGIPVVASPVGEHNYLIRDGVNGFLATSNEEWVSKVAELIENTQLRNKIGGLGRETVTNGYSLRVVAERFANMVHEFADGRRQDEPGRNL